MGISFMIRYGYVNSMKRGYKVVYAMMQTIDLPMGVI